MDEGPQPISVEESIDFEYSAAYCLLAEAREQAFEKYRAEASRRRTIVLAVFAAWLIATLALYFIVSPDMLVAGEIGFAAWLAFAVFYLLPSIMGKSNLKEAFDQYEARLAELEAALVPLPACDTIEELADVLSVAQVPDAAQAL